MEEPYYDEDAPRSPGLEIPKVNYEPKESPPPFLEKGSDSDAAKKSADEGTSHDCSPPNRPDIAAYERNHPLSEDLRREHDPDFPRGHQLRKLNPPPTADESPKQPIDLARSALGLLQGPKPDEVPLVSPGDPDVKSRAFDASILLRDHEPLKREPDSPRISPTPFNFQNVEKKSPLNKFIVPPSDVPAHNLLPALHSPDNNHTLPSLQTMGLSSVAKDSPGRPKGSSPRFLPPVTATSPPALRSEPVWEQQRPVPFCPQVPPSPYSHWSPASTTAGNLSAVSSPASQNSHWRSLKSEISYLTASSPYDVTHSTAKSPATSYPTPTDQTPASTCDRTPYNPSTQPNGASVSTGAFKCGWPGCTAPPFQTQYLLNSHANVHSQERPHFCSVEGCPRGPGGKGFKRKNEMIRHGLVHNSPGYVCPFCPDQQHKYPRPDNLQRHVRVHHVDKSKDDPALRQVLSQRPEGSVRGRRRRQSVQ